MVESEDQQENNVQSEILFSKVIPKTTKDGKRQTGSLTVETKTYQGYKFIQITQEKFAFGSQPSKRSWVTLDISDRNVKDALSDAFKK